MCQNPESEQRFLSVQTSVKAIQRVGKDFTKILNIYCNITMKKYYTTILSSLNL